MQTAAVGKQTRPRYLAALNAITGWLERVSVRPAFGRGRDTTILVWVWFVWGIGAGLWSYFWPVYLDRLGATSVAIGLVVGAGSLAATLVYLPGGLVAQLGHQKWQMVLQHLLAAITTGSFGLAGSWWHVLPAVVIANAAAIFSPATNSYITRAADADGVPVPSIYTALGTAQFATMTLSPPLGGLLAERFGMAALFPLVFCCYVAGVAGMCLLRAHPPVPPPATPPTDLTGAPTATPQAQAQSPDQTAPERPAPAPARRRATTRSRAWTASAGTYDAILRSPVVRMLLLHSLVVYTGVHLALSFAPLYLRDQYAYDATAIGWAGSAASAGAALLLLAVERLRRRRGPVIAMWLSTGLIALHLGATVLSPLLPVQLASFFFRGGVQTASTLTTVVLAAAVPRASLGPAVAMFATVAGLAAIAAPPLGGALYAFAPSMPFLAGTALLLASLPLATAAFRARRTNG
ncbi:MAG TPA: MFS transporter [Chloroflexota bacterium]|nr:MFS transporter [Chloroflexota bacterium]